MSEHDDTEPITAPTAFNLPLDSHMPENWTPLECVVVVECLDSEGTKRLYVAATEGISTWSTYGALMAAANSYGDDLKSSLLADDEGDDLDE